MKLDSSDAAAAASGLAGRYAAALFDLALEAQALDATATDLGRLEQALAEAPDFAALINAPQVSRDDAGKAVAAIAGGLGLGDLATRLLGVLAGNGRLAALPGIVGEYRAMLARHRGTATARVVSARPLAPAQVAALEAKLRQRTGRATMVDLKVDPAILGGLVVRIGSEQIDTSIRTRLERLGQQMKGS